MAFQIASQLSSPDPPTATVPPTAVEPPTAANSIPFSSAIVGAASNTTACKHFRFNEQLDLLLLRACVTAGAHVAPWDKNQELFEKSFDMFASAEIFKAMRSSARPTWKSLSDRFKKLVADRRTANRNNGAASGISEVHSEREQLLDDILIQIDEKQETERAEKEEKTTQEKRLQEAGEKMRNSAVKRLRRNKTRTSPANTSSGDSDAETKLIAREIETRKLAQEARRRIDEERLELEREKGVREVAHMKLVEDVDLRRVTVDERRAALEEKIFEADQEARKDDKEERRLALEERKALIGVLGALAGKLGSDDWNKSA